MLLFQPSNVHSLEILSIESTAKNVKEVFVSNLFDLKINPFSPLKEIHVFLFFHVNLILLRASFVDKK